MFLCPKCGGETSVNSSRRTLKNNEKRRRQCSACGFKFYTYEILKTEIEQRDFLEKTLENLLYEVNLFRERITSIITTPSLPKDCQDCTENNSGIDL